VSKGWVLATKREVEGFGRMAREKKVIEKLR
jgi:hypothetical protein